MFARDIDGGGRSMSFRCSPVMQAQVCGYVCCCYRVLAALVAVFAVDLVRTPARNYYILLRHYLQVEQRDVNMRRALVLRALPVYLREDASKFFRTCNSADGPDLTDTPVALLTVVTDDTTDAALFSPESICIVVEDEILVSGPTNLADSFLLLFGLFGVFRPFLAGATVSEYT
ncbi:hypothetical protein J4Q44_G00266740 [Coregonus suidteri]|uniref:Uncharacterized protein n=1 Tax=Coregonus suidteri TaxID=861788 RepID=A0AAN8KW82_9TELE